MRTSRRSCLAALVALPHARPAAYSLQVALDVRVALCGAKAAPVQEEAWVHAHVAAAQAIMQTHNVALSARVSRFSPLRCDLLTRAHRDAFAKYADAPKTVSVFVVSLVRDLDVRNYDLMGVHWRYGGHQNAFANRRWLFLTSRAQAPVLAHELCHFFGLPHDEAGGNLMTPGPSSPAWRTTKPPAPFKPVLTARQVAAVRTGIVRWQQQ